MLFSYFVYFIQDTSTPYFKQKSFMHFEDYQVNVSISFNGAESSVRTLHGLLARFIKQCQIYASLHDKIVFVAAHWGPESIYWLTVFIIMKNL